MNGPADLKPASSPDGIVLLGFGGHGRVCLDILRLGYPGREIAVLDHDRTTGQSEGLIHLGDDDSLPQLVDLGWTTFVCSLGLIQGTKRRKDLFDQACRSGLTPLTLTHPSATLATNVDRLAGAQIMAGAVLQPGVRIGRNAVINTNATVEHDCQVGDHAFIAPGAILLGGVTVGQGALVGAGAVLLPGTSVEAGEEVPAATRR